MKFFQGMLLIISGLVVIPSSAAEVTEIAKLAFETRILSFDPFSGVKSIHVVTLKKADKKITFSDTYSTGTTELWFGISLSSLRDNFKILNTSYDLDQERAGFKVTGETASGVGVVPNINYSFDIRLTGERIFINGCHDGYPAYTVTLIIPGNSPIVVYDFKHKSLEVLNLFGTCDIAVTASVELP